MTPEQAQEYVQLAKADPARAIVEARQALDDPDLSDGVRSILYRSVALAARMTDDEEVSSEHARHSVAAAETAADESLLVDALITLAGSSAIAGDNEAAIAHLERARGLASGLQQAEVVFQNGAVRARMGESAAARALFSEALPVFVEHGDEESVAMTVHNRGMLNLQSGDISGAIEDFDSARQIHRRLGNTTALAGAEHNMGVALAGSGDLPLALKTLDDAEEIFREIGHSVAEVQVSRVEVLMSAGLFAEARSLADELSGELQRLHLEGDRAEALLAGSVAARLAGDPEVATVMARRAAELFEAQRREAWTRNALRVELAARLDAGDVTPEDIDRAAGLAEDLEEDGLVEPALDSRLTAGLIAARLGAQSEAILNLRAVPRVSTGPLQRRLSATYANAVVRDLEGDKAGAEQTARDGLDMLADYQQVVGATDVQAGIDRHGRQLARFGLEKAMERGDEIRILEWLELARAGHLRFRTVRPPADPELAADLAELRTVQIASRSGDRREQVALDERRVALETAIRDRSRHIPGATHDVGGVSGDRILEAMGTVPLVEFAEVGDQLWRFSSVDGQIEFAPVGSLAAIEKDLKMLRFGLRLLARGRDNLESVRSSIDGLGEHLFGGLALNREEAVVVPVPQMYAVPWSVLPGLHDIDLVVAPSADTYVERHGTPPTNLDRAVVITGPDLEHAVGEGRRIAEIYGEGAAAAETVGETLATLDGTDIAHFASHATFVAENPMFSSLRLTDGDLHVYDMEYVARPPAVVALSACDSGFSESRPGEELLGLSAALLRRGTHSVVASVGLVPDSVATGELMTSFHRSLLDGSSPSKALRIARQSVADVEGGYVAAASFVCIGGA